MMVGTEEELGPQLFLHRVDLPGKRRLCDMKSFRGPMKATFPGQSEHKYLCFERNIRIHNVPASPSTGRLRMGPNVPRQNRRSLFWFRQFSARQEREWYLCAPPSPKLHCL